MAAVIRWVRKAKVPKKKSVDDLPLHWSVIIFPENDNPKNEAVV
jgi:hypothetical protein